MNTTTVTIRSVHPIYGRARGHAGDATSGDPRLVIDTPDGERIYATFATGVSVTAEAHYRSFAHEAAQRMDSASRMDLAASLLSVLERVIGDWHTPRVPDCCCTGLASGCWEIACTDCGRPAEAYDDDTASDYLVHWACRDEALEDCSALGFEWWEDEPGQPVLCADCIDARLGPSV